MEELPGLYFMRARYYSADCAVFLSTDPVKNIGPAWHPDAYSYAGGNPLSAYDPSGEFWNIVAGALIGGGIEVASQLLQGSSIKEINWAEVGGAALKGGLMASGFGAVAVIAGSAAISAATEAANEIIYEDDAYEWEDVVGRGLVGGLEGMGGYSVGNSGQLYKGAVRGASPQHLHALLFGSHTRNTVYRPIIERGIDKIAAQLTGTGNGGGSVAGGGARRSSSSPTTLGANSYAIAVNQQNTFIGSRGSSTSGSTVTPLSVQLSDKASRAKRAGKGYAQQASGYYAEYQRQQALYQNLITSFQNTDYFNYFLASQEPKHLAEQAYSQYRYYQSQAEQAMERYSSYKSAAGAARRAGL